MRVAVAFVVAALVLTACGDDGGADAPTDGLVGATPEIHVYDAWVGPPSDGVAEISMRVHNGGPEDDRLLDATCACDGVVAIDGALVVSPDEEVVLAPGGTPGLRLTDLADGLPKGGFITLTLTFEHAGAATTEVEVRRRST